MSKFRVIRVRLLLFLFSFMSIGAAEFPLFRMEDLEFEARKTRPEFEEINQFPIPRVSKRLYGEGEQERLPVDRIVIEGVVPHPELNITQEKIQEIIDNKFYDQQAVELDDNGFTKRDYDDIGQFLRTILDRGSEPDAEDARALILKLDEIENERGWITIEQLDAIALAVTEHYRENGFILATAFIPEQEVISDPVTNEKVISLSVLEGRLGEVVVSNNEIFEDATIMASFDKEIGEPVTEEQVESALRRINDLPGVRVRGSFSPGDNVGETRLNLGVLQEQSWTSSILADNHGPQTTGAIRLFATTHWLNIADRGHQLVVGLLRSEGPDSTTYGVVEYEIPFTKDGRGRLRASFSSNEFAVTRLAALPEIIGETDNYALTGSYQFLRGRTQSLKAVAAYTQKDVLFQVGQLTTLSTDQVIETISVGADYTRLWDERQLLFTGRLGMDQGRFISGELRGQSADFTKILFNANLLKRFSIYNWLTKKNNPEKKKNTFFNFVIKINSQFTEKFLASVEQFSLGGPTGVRAFGVSEVSVDSGAYAGFELFFDMPVDPVKMFNLPLDPLRPFLFYDYAYGVARGLGSGRDRDAIIKGYGLGMRISWPGTGVANLILAKPQSANYQDDFLSDPGKARIYLDVTYKIH
jgi:hemolysin activation/secretion protein